MIHQRIESERQLTINTCSGTILKQEVINVIKMHYASEPIPNHLWDITEADLSQINTDDLQDIVEFTKQYVPTRMYGRTALVSASSLGFGLARMYKAFSENAGLKIEINVFRSHEEAKEWMFAVSGEEVPYQSYHIA